MGQRASLMEVISLSAAIITACRYPFPLDGCAYRSATVARKRHVGTIFHEQMAYYRVEAWFYFFFLLVPVKIWQCMGVFFPPPHTSTFQYVDGALRAKNEALL